MDRIANVDSRKRNVGLSFDHGNESKKAGFLLFN